MSWFNNSIQSTLASQQEAVNTANQNAGIANSSAAIYQQIAQAAASREKRLEEEIRNLKATIEAGDTSGIIKGLRERNEQLTQTGKDKDAEIARQKDLLRQWMISQTAFKSLFKRYGVLPDGRPVSDAPKNEVQSIVDTELSKMENEISKTDV